MTRSLLAALALVAAASAAPAQDFNDGLRRAFTAIPRSPGDRIATLAARAFDRPEVGAAYRAGACGYGLTPQQFAYKWAATGGCTGAWRVDERKASPEEWARYRAYLDGLAAARRSAGPAIGGDPVHWPVQWRPAAATMPNR